MAAHKTAKIKNFFNQNKINVVYNIPYVSEFNCAELIFRYLKLHLYNNLYETIEDEEKDVKLLLENDKNISILLKNYEETLQTYLEYSLKYKSKNLNNLDYQL